MTSSAHPAGHTEHWPTRAERPGDTDAAAVRRVELAAFDTTEEADLVEALRADPEAWLPHLSWLAVSPDDGAAVGHALLTRCHIGDTPALALAPCAVLPAHQGQGAGTAVIRAALDAARDAGEHTAVVLGHPPYYPRFGFTPCAGHGITPPPGQEWPAEAFLALSLDGTPLPRGAVRYPKPFGL